jgi:hypothetical protein
MKKVLKRVEEDLKLPYIYFEDGMLLFPNHIPPFFTIVHDNIMILNARILQFLTDVVQFAFKDKYILKIQLLKSSDQLIHSFFNMLYLQ